MSQRTTRSNKKDNSTADMLKNLSNDFQTQMCSFKNELQKKLDSAESSSGGAVQDVQKIYMQELMSKFVSFENNISLRLKLLEEQIINQCDILEQKSYENNLILHGLPEVVGDSLLQEVLHVFSNQLKITNLDMKDISVAYRLGKKSDKPRPVVIVFLRVWQRNLVFSNKSKLKGSKLFMSEMLVKSKLRLFNEVKEIYKNKCFTITGRIAVILNNKLHFIDSQIDFNKLKELS